MSRVVYVNGAYLPEKEARISIFDRGFLFADAVYEVISVLDGKLIDFAGHEKRLCRSLSELEMDSPVSHAELLGICRRLLSSNQLSEGLIYLQISRGAADRDFVYPAYADPTIVLFTQARKIVDNPLAKTGMKIVSVEDLRWRRRDIKTVQLLYSSMARMRARRAGADDAWMVEDGLVTEGTASNAYIVRDGRIITRPIGRDILSGVTRAAVIEAARQSRIEFEERAFSLAEAKAAEEAFITASTNFVMPVVRIDNAPVGDGRPGPMVTGLRRLYIERMRETAI